MKILHYTLGLPPYRSGGLTTYSYDLMIEQLKHNDDVYLLFPGRLRFINKEASIKYYGMISGVSVYELINPLPVPLMDGVNNGPEYRKEVDIDIYIEFLKKINVEIVHIHSFMGLHKEFLSAAKKLGISIVYTTHDYYGLCTKVNFLDKNGDVCKGRNIQKCLECNFHKNDIKKIMILQSRIYRELKNQGVVEKIRGFTTKISSLKKSQNTRAESNSIQRIFTKNEKQEYEKLLDYYDHMFSMIDRFIFNSSIARDVYNKTISAKGDIVIITHKNISDNRKIKNYDKKGLKLTYLGPDKEYKGYYLLDNVMRRLLLEGYKDIKLNIYGKTNAMGKVSENIYCNGPYSYDQLEDIFDNTDLLIVPSVWFETFGFIT